MKLNPLQQTHDMAAAMTEGQMRCLTYDLRQMRTLDESEALALSHLLEDLHAEAAKLANDNLALTQQNAELRDKLDNA